MMSFVQVFCQCEFLKPLFPREEINLTVHLSWFFELNTFLGFVFLYPILASIHMQFFFVSLHDFLGKTRVTFLLNTTVFLPFSPTSSILKIFQNIFSGKVHEKGLNPVVNLSRFCQDFSYKMLPAARAQLPKAISRNFSPTF